MKQTLLEDINRIKSLMNINEGEAQFDSSEKSIIDKFVDFVKKELNLEYDVEIKLQNDKDGIKTTAVYKYAENGDENYEDSEIRVFALGRALVDVLRSIAHELVHHQQNEDGRLENVDSSPGSPVENEANSVAGELIKKFGKDNPEIYNGEGEQGEMTEDDGESESSSPEPETSSSTSTGGSVGGGGGSSDSGSSSDGGQSYPSVTKWGTWLTRGPANQITISVWSTNMNRGKANTLDNSKWDSGITRGKANTLI